MRFSLLQVERLLVQVPENNQSSLAAAVMAMRRLDRCSTTRYGRLGSPREKSNSILHPVGRTTLRVLAAGKDKERVPWDFGRFVSTVLYFNPPPPPDQILKTVLEQPAK